MGTRSSAGSPWLGSRLGGCGGDACKIGGCGGGIDPCSPFRGGSGDAGGQRGWRKSCGDTSSHPKMWKSTRKKPSPCGCR